MLKPKSIEGIIAFILIIVCVVAARFIGSEILVLAVFIITLGIYAWRKYDSRMLVGAAIFLLVVCAALLASGSEHYANDVAIRAYYFLVVGVLGLFIEYLGGEGHEIELRKRVYLIFYFALSIAVLGILLKSGYILSLDMIFGPSPKPDFYGLHGPPVHGGGIWLYALIQLSSLVAPTWVIQKLFLLLIFFISGVSAHSLIETKSSVPRYFAGILYMINPFIYVRFLAGHWGILFAYSITPFAIKYFLKFLNYPSRRNALKVLIPLAFISVNAHVLALNLLALFVIFCFKAAELRLKIKKVIPRLALLALAFLAINAYWLIPLATTEETLVQQITERDLFVFAPRGEGFSVPYSLATMYGFWRGGYTYTKDIFPAWHLFFIIILFLSIHGFLSNYKNRKAQSFVAIGIISFLLAMSVLGPFSQLFENVSILRGFRDSQKFVGLLVLAYAYLGALGVNSLLSHFKRNNKKILSISIIAIALVTPIAYNFTQFGFWGQLQPTDYPADWYQANEILNADNQDFNVLFLPWHLYMDFRFVPNRDKRIANPAEVFFDKPVIQGYNLEVPGIYTQSTNPGQMYIQSILSSGEISGENLRLLNVKYIMLAKEVDWAWYRDALERSDLELIFDSENLMIYKNPVQVSRFYEADELPPEALEPLDYKIVSPVEYEVTGDNEKCTIFVPPNLDSSDWVLDGKEAPAGFYAAWEDRGGRVRYSQFRTYEFSYIISLLSPAAIVGVYLLVRGYPKRKKFWAFTRDWLREGF
ncbi:MAG: hypothetical protein IBX64_06955 [Actinobacteria bacterium]|nr:hypothetical protein [Actinomycetota bacterium]